ncbi:DNA polymerase III subunit alpha [Paeniglutamicibacter antarcticus]|uniref:DNA-directed DNA polymerase n=1 Tax=Arthrobacter terrae TaxID=2935737 RepID=A0A931CHG7_9MICC|nr:DNA polymerase III subunit alpha [Arthrobacter terrae]MBG0738667.1 DNA polymerase III subunit alpha [Arthrobacter terrae]
MAFVHLHNHTEFSSLDGLSRLKTVAKTAAALGQTAMAETEHGSLAGAWRFTKACQAAGIKPIIGIEIYMSIGDRFLRNSEIVDRNDDTTADADDGKGETKEKRYEHLTLLARNEQGWKNLLALHNKAEESYWYKPRIDYALLKEHGEGLIVLTGCLAGPVAGPLSRAAATAAAGDAEKSVEFASEAKNNLDTLIDCVGKENVYLEIMYHGIGAEQSVLKPIAQLSREYDVPMVVTNDCHYEKDEDSGAHEGFLAVGSKKGLDDPARFKFNGGGYYVKSEQEMLDIKPGSKTWADACAMTQVIADRCDDQVIPTPHQRLPKYPLPEGFTDSNVYLKKLVKDGAVNRYGYDLATKERIPLSAEVKERLKTELDIIAEMGFPDYFLIMWDVINWCRTDAPIEFDNPDAPRKKPILVGPGRGSAAGSAVSYCLRIVGIDPLYNNLLFERFLEPGRAGMPDIDVDFEKARRDEVFAYLAYRWGKGNVARIGTFGVALSKAAIKDAARILKPSGPSEEIKAQAKEFFIAGERGKGATLLRDAEKVAADRAAQKMRLGNKMSDLVPASGEKAYDFAQLTDTKDQAGQAFRDLVDESGEDAQAILELARAFEGVIKNESIHACGFVVSPEPLDELVPLRWASHAADADPAAPRVICWDGPEVEDYGFLKMDILGLMNLDIVSTALENIEMTTGEHLTMDSIPHPDIKGDPKVDAAFALIAAGNTGGVFQMESGGMVKIAQDVVPESLTDISAIVALFRPGPLAAKVPDRYAARKNGREEVDYDEFTSNKMEQEWIAKVLDDTYGKFVFQEQLMRLGTVISGFDASQRSVLRKAVGKKDAKKMAEVGKMLAAGAEQEFFDESGVLISPKFSAKTAAHMFELMKGSASYLFNASHSAAYAQLAFVTAYLKANWPVEYAAAILAIADKDDKRMNAFWSLKTDGITVLAPDINLSLARTAPVNGSVQMGLAEVKEVGAAGHYILAERILNGEFKNLHDVLTRVTVPGKNGTEPTKLPVGAIQGLIEAGAMDSFGPRLGQLMTLRAAHKSDLSPIDAEWSDVEESTRQRQRLGVSLGTHPLQSLKEEILAWEGPAGGRATPLHKIADENGEAVLTVGVISMWEEKGYSGGRRANFALESSKVTIQGVMWDRTLSNLRRRGTVPKVGDVVAVSGKVNVRTTSVGDEDVETQETITTKELSIFEVWQIASATAPEINEPRAVIDFAAKYRELRATNPDKPKGPGGKDDETDKAPAGEPKKVFVAEVTDLEDHRKKSRSRLVVVATSALGRGLTGRILVGDPAVVKPHSSTSWPTKKVQPGSIYRVMCPGGDIVILLVKSPSLGHSQLLEISNDVTVEDPRWTKQDGSNALYTWYLLEQTAEQAVEEEDTQAA